MNLNGAALPAKAALSLRKIIFKDTEGGIELTLPVTPPSFEWTYGINIEVVNIHTLGDVSLAGYESLGSVKLEVLFPANAYPFNNPSAGTSPYNYVEQFEKWSGAGTVLRYIVSGTGLNEAVLAESIQYGERDGTGDVYATLSLRGYRPLTAEKVETSGAGNAARTDEAATAATQTYLIVSGDTLSAICRRFYGDAALYPALASYNGIKNPNLIYAGDTLTIPDKRLL